MTRTPLALGGRAGALALACAGVVLAAVGIGPTRADQTKPGAALTTKAADSGDRIPEVQEAVERFRRGDLAGALEKLQEARKGHPELPPAKLMLARMLLSSNQLPTGRGLLEDVAAEDPGYPVTYLLFGNLALADNRVSDAQLNYQKVRETVADTDALTPDQRTDIGAQAISGLGAVAERRQQWATAQALLEELLKLKPQDGPARQRLARALFQLDRREDALAQLQQAVQADPGLDPPGVTMGWLLADKGLHDDALKSMQEAVKSDPESPTAQLGLGTYLLQRERPQDARPHAEAALKQAPDSLPARRLLGAIAYRLGRYDEAEEHLRAVLEGSPDDLTTGSLLAMVLADKPEEASHQQAVELAQQNLQRSGQSPQTLATLGWAYYRAGRLDEAAQALQAATSSGQATPDIAYYMACVLADKGQEADALRLLRSALDAPVGQFAARDAARRRLEALAQKATQPADGASTKAAPATTKPAAPKAAAPKAAAPKAGARPGSP